MPLSAASMAAGSITSGCVGAVAGTGLLPGVAAAAAAASKPVTTATRVFVFQFINPSCLLPRRTADALLRQHHIIDPQI